MKQQPTTDFDWDSIDRGDPLQAELERRDDAIHGTAEAFNAILCWCWQPNGDRRGAFARFLVMSAVVNPEIVPGSYATLGARYGLTKQRLSKLAGEFEQKFGMHMRRTGKNRVVK